MNRYFGCLRRAIRWALDEDIITSHPRLEKNGKVSGLPARAALTVEELARLWNASPEPYLQAFLMVLMTTACRHEAALDLTRLQCDLAAGTVDLNGPRARTHKRRPVILMANALRPWVVASSGGHLVQKHGRPLRSCIIPFRRARERAGLSAAVCPHAIRKTMATLMGAVHNVPRFQISAWLGHEGENTTTERHYIKPDIRFLGDARAATDSIVSEVL